MTATTNRFTHILALIVALTLTTATPGRAAAPAPVGDAVAEDGRIYRDFAFAPEFPAESALSLRLRLAAPIPAEGLRRFSVYLKSGGGWYAAHVGSSADDFRDGRQIRIPLGSFAKEGDPAPISKADTVRIAAWKTGDYSADIALADADFCAGATVAVVLPTAATAPGEESFAADMAGRCGAILRKCHFEFDFIGDDFRKLAAGAGAGDPPNPRLVFIPYCPKLSEGAARQLTDFTKSGGRLVVFYNGSKTLGRALGVDPGAWRSSGKRAYTALDATPLLGQPRRVPHVTEGVITPLPLPGHGARKIATWVSGYSTATHSTAATLSPTGAWFAHVPPRAYPAAVDMFTAISTNLVPSLSQTIPAPAPRPAVLGAARDFPLAAWANTMDIPGAFSDRMPGISAIYVRILPTDAASAPRLGGIATHAWISCFTTDGLPKETIEALRREKRLSETNPKWMSPLSKDNREIVVGQLVDAAKSGVAGIHLDYVRTEYPTPASPQMTQAITDFVREASRAVRAVDPGIEISAAVYPTPESAARHNQDWPAWVAEGLVDYVCPMLYTEFPEEFRHMLSECTGAVPASKIMAGIGSGANDSQTDAATTRREIEIAAEAGCRGAVFFTLNDSLAELLEAR